jgi:hypothetical protein
LEADFHWHYCARNRNDYTCRCGYIWRIFHMSPEDAGICWITGQPVFEILEKDKDGHPVRLGPPLSCAVEVTVLLVGGSLTTITVHEDVVHKAPNILPQLWHQIMNAMVAGVEEAARQALGDRRTPEQIKTQMAELTRLCYNRPIGILALERSIERGQREKAAGSH